MVKPQDKEMKMQWITVDGRRTPIILPQIWDHEKEDWEVTSTENPLPTQVTRSNVEDGLPVKSAGNKVERFKVLERGIRNESDLTIRIYDGDYIVPLDVKRVIIQLNIFGISGVFGDGEGYSLRLVRVNQFNNQLDVIAESEFSTKTNNYSGSLMVIDPSIAKEKEERGRFLLIPDAVIPGARLMLFIEGEFDEGEGVDCEAYATFVY